MSQTRVTVIPPRMNLQLVPFSAEYVKKRVAAYARVSTDTEEQLSSYEAQVDHYTRHIQANDEWEFVKVYTDEGISATSTAKRDGFKEMVQDALDGKIDLIITKSVSRFARNTVDSLTTVRQLKEKGVEVYFEKENIYTLDSKGELLITIMSSLAQEESRSISENVTWGQRKRMQDGKVTLPYKRFLGYEKGEDGLPKIVESEAVTVRMIYRLFLEGKTPSWIAKHLTSGILTPARKTIWQSTTVLSILQNEKYKGDAILQKTFCVDFLTKKMKVNEGEVPQYYVENSHPSIIMPETFDMVQHELSKRKGYRGYKASDSPFSGKVICGECGGVYGSKVWHSTSKYRRTIWQCNHKYKGEKCNTPHLYETALQKAFVEVFNQLIENKDEVLSDYETVILTLTDTSSLEKRQAELKSEYDIVMELMRKCVEENARTVLDQNEYNRRYDVLMKRYETARNGITEINDKLLERTAKRERITSFLDDLKCHDKLVTEFDEKLWLATIESVTVHSESTMTVKFKDGGETHVDIEKN